MQALSLLGAGAAIVMIAGLRRPWRAVGLGAGLASGVSAAGLLALAGGGPGLVWFFPELWPAFVPFLALRLGGASVAIVGALFSLTRGKGQSMGVAAPGPDPA